MRRVCWTRPEQTALPDISTPAERHWSGRDKPADQLVQHEVSQTLSFGLSLRCPIGQVIFIEVKISKKNTNIILRNAILKHIYSYQFVGFFFLAG